MPEATSDPSPGPSTAPPGQWKFVAVAAIAVVALGLAGWAALRPAPGTDVSYTDAQRAEGKTKICTAFELVRTGVTRNTTLQAPGGASDVAGALAVAANARVALYDGGQYLLARLDPATPPQLADAVHAFADDLMDIGAAATAGIQNTDPAQAARQSHAAGVNTTVTRLCA